MPFNCVIKIKYIYRTILSSSSGVRVVTNIQSDRFTNRNYLNIVKSCLGASNVYKTAENRESKFFPNIIHSPCVEESNVGCRPFTGFDYIYRDQQWKISNTYASSSWFTFKRKKKVYICFHFIQKLKIKLSNTLDMVTCLYLFLSSNYQDSNYEAIIFMQL